MGAYSRLNIVPKYKKLGEGFTREEIFWSQVHPGRRTDGSQPRAGWLDDLVQLKKCIILCSYCRVNFNPRKHHYRKFYCADITGITDGTATNGRCDSCKEMTVNCGGGTSFVHEETYNLVCRDPMDARRRAKAQARAVSAWQMIQKTRRKH